MRVTEYTPKWRHCLTPIEIVEQPTPEWFVDKQHTRFAVLQDGRVICGSGETIIHGDITRAAPQLGWPLSCACGVLMRYDGHPWFLCALEAPWGRSEKDQDDLEHLLHRLTTWIEDTRCLGHVKQGPKFK